MLVSACRAADRTCATVGAVAGACFMGPQRITREFFSQAWGTRSASGDWHSCNVLWHAEAKAHRAATFAGHILMGGSSKRHAAAKVYMALLVGLCLCLAHGGSMVGLRPL